MTSSRISLRDFASSRPSISGVKISDNDLTSLRKKLEELRQEAPYAYKGIGPIINTLTDANIARPVAELVPIMTVKG